ncbi:heme o synthase [Marinicrinis sediminis]|uniref:Protoheme IX farnesyltransferase n=1 Tax=Marinicrinis sediminis TaxID=1652465 RepID=A0ABW5R6Q1_9BACL
MDKQLEMKSSSTPAVEQSLTWRDFIEITKPRIIKSNLIAAFGGFWLASQWNIDWLLFVYMLLGSTLVMASSCVFNNYLDRELDTKMARTKHRPTATGKMKPSIVLWYGILLGVAGLIVLSVINILTAVLGAVGMFFYVVVYTMWLKRTSTWSTSVGGVSGAVPPVIGYTAVTNTIDMGAILLFALLFLWQPPHFWALGIRKREEYRAAGFPLLPVVKGVTRTKWQMLPYVILLLPFSILMYVYNYTGLIFLVVSLVLGVIWLWICIKGLRLTGEKEDEWARKAFLFSIQYLMVSFLIMIIDTTRV